MFRLLTDAALAVVSTITARAVWAVDTLAILRMCACGHPARLHEHYRAGTDCGSCGPARCPAYRYRPLTIRRP